MSISRKIVVERTVLQHSSLKDSSQEAPSPVVEAEVSSFCLEKFLARGICSLLILSSSACSLVAPSSQNVTIASDPAGAKVTVNGAYVGTTPTVYNTRRDEPLSLMVSKDGYETAVRSVSTKISGTGIVDIIGGCIWLVPFLGLLAPGAWEVDSSNLTVQLAPKSTPRATKTRY